MSRTVFTSIHGVGLPRKLFFQMSFETRIVYVCGIGPRQLGLFQIAISCDKTGPSRCHRIGPSVFATHRSLLSIGMFSHCSMCETNDWVIVLCIWTRMAYPCTIVGVHIYKHSSIEGEKVRESYKVDIEPRLYCDPVRHCSITQATVGTLVVTLLAQHKTLHRVK
jgi:hypothetical protein